MELAIQADDVRAAAARIRPLARKTPVVTSASFDAEAGTRVYFKCENLQRGGAFKIRGASNLILSLPESALARGIVAGCSTIAKAMHPAMRVFGAEPEGANDTFLSMRAGVRVAVHPETIADGLRAPKPGELTFPVLRKLVEQVVTVSEDEIRAAVKFVLLRLKLLVEPSGAVPAAAVLFRKLPREIRSVGVVLSGGNVDFEDLVAY